MHAWLAIALLSGAALLAGPAFAQDAEALRKELDQMKKQFEEMKQQYQRSIDHMSERLKRVEETPAVPAPAAQAPATPAPAPPSTPSVVDLLRPRVPFALYDRPGGGGLLFDIGASADFIGSFSSGNVERANAGTFPGETNRVFPREVDLVLFGAIDPYATGVITLEAEEEFENGSPTINFTLIEANFTLTSLPWGFQVKTGKLLNRFGLLNELHKEALPQPDQPNVLTNFFGQEGLNETGVEVTWTPELPFYLQALAGVSNGDNDVAFGYGSFRQPLYTGRLRTFLDLESFGGLQFGGSFAVGTNTDGLNTTIVGYDLKYKLIPEGWRHPLFTLASEGLWGWRSTKVTTDSSTQTVRNRAFGWYIYGQVQPWQRWLFGVRYDNSQFLDQPGRQWAIEPYIAFQPSDFLRFRLAYKHTDNSPASLFTVNGAPVNPVDEVFLQATFFLGAHPAHGF